MNLQSSNRPHGLTLIELLVVLLLLGLLAAMLLPALHRPQTRSKRIGCVNNLKQIGLGFRIFATDNGDRFPTHTYTNWPGLPAEPGAAVFLLRTVREELSTPKVLCCPSDKDRTWATNWPALTRSNLSYFIGVDAQESQPQSLLAGDRNLEVNGRPAGPGLFTLTTNAQVGWTDQIHRRCGNVALGDGSVQQVTPVSLRTQLRGGGVQPQRLLIP